MQNTQHNWTDFKGEEGEDESESAIFFYDPKTGRGRKKDSRINKSFVRFEKQNNKKKLAVNLRFLVSDTQDK
jgi:hypothetical protein